MASLWKSTGGQARARARFTGKSEVIKRLRQLFNKLGWSKDAEFMCAAPMDLIAALIGGVTVHDIGGLGFDLLPGGQAGEQTRYDEDTVKFVEMAFNRRGRKMYLSSYWSQSSSRSPTPLALARFPLPHNQMVQGGISVA